MKINGEEHNDLCVGIDLGTTNSVLATINVKPNGDAVSKVIDIPRAVDMYMAGAGSKFSTQKRATLPSCVYYNEEKNYQPIVGDFAKSRYSLRPYLVAKSIKSQMGNPKVTNLAPEIKDDTPAKVSSRILQHMLKNAERIFRMEIHDAVITVPANFDSVMCQATREAAEMAGILVRNSDGTERPVLLPEPNAVIYDFLNQVRNGEISSHIIDLSTRKNVMVFDLGGGTLDITLHSIVRRPDYPDVLKVDEIATNRYTLLGGDDFDKAIAEAMFKRYIEQYKHRGLSEVVSKIKREEQAVKAQLLSYAEDLKITLSTRNSSDVNVSDDSGWWDEDEDDSYPVGGNISSTGYSYDDTFTKDELENILLPFMGQGLHFEDYHHIDAIAREQGTRNIIYPILDVLAKAAEKTGIDDAHDVHIDAVIMNGGMSRFYMVIERLKEFFGFEPVMALDPDQAVARGAAVYHYYLHKYEALKDDMRMGGLRSIHVARQVSEQHETTADSAPANTPAASGRAESAPHPQADMLLAQNRPKLGISWGKTILNDSLYLGMKNDTREEIIRTGTELPYQSERMTGFRLSPGADHIAIPIKSRNLDNTFRIIGRGSIQFGRDYPDGAYVSIRVAMSRDKVITFEACTSRDAAGEQIEGNGSCKILIGSGLNQGKNARKKIISRDGSCLKPETELHTIEQLCKNFEGMKYIHKGNVDSKRSEKAKEIKMLVSSVCNAGNPEDFANPLLRMVSESRSEEFKQRCLIIARRIGHVWNDAQLRRLADFCMGQLSAELEGWDSQSFFGGKEAKNTKIQAVYTLYMCASPSELHKLAALHDYSSYHEACLYTHSRTKTAIDWIYKEFHQACKNARKTHTGVLQNSAYAIGMAYCLDGRPMESNHVNKNKVVKELCTVMYQKRVSVDDAIPCILALGWLCDQRADNTLSSQCVDDALRLLSDLSDLFDYTEIERLVKARSVAMKMIQGMELLENEERFLLEKMER